jgi:SPP1 gp7 family putative phage head morphogenesis protein
MHMTPIKLAAILAPKHRRPRKPRRMQPPLIIEHRYRKALRKLASDMGKRVQEIIVPELPGLLPGDRRADSDFHLDETIAEKVARLIASVRYSLDDEFDEADLKALIESAASEINGFNRLQVAEMFKSILGVDLLSAQPDLSETLAAFVGENVSLITSVREQFLGQVEQVILRGARAGLRHEEVARQLVGEAMDGFVSRLGVAESRAELIARDQTNKLYGQLTELRQTEAGVEKYVWRTAMDERVREEHQALEGETFAWDDPPSEGHPGEPINCRCYAEPVIPGAQDEGA